MVERLSLLPEDVFTADGRAALITAVDCVVLRRVVLQLLRSVGCQLLLPRRHRLRIELDADWNEATGHLFHQRQVDRRKRRDHVLFTVVLAHQLVVALCQLADLLLTGVLGRR